MALTELKKDSEAIKEGGKVPHASSKDDNTAQAEGPSELGLTHPGGRAVAAATLASAPPAPVRRGAGACSRGVIARASTRPRARSLQPATLAVAEGTVATATRLLRSPF